MIFGPLNFTRNIYPLLSNYLQTLKKVGNCLIFFCQTCCKVWTWASETQASHQQFSLSISLPFPSSFFSFQRQSYAICLSILTSFFSRQFWCVSFLYILTICCFTRLPLIIILQSLLPIIVADITVFLTRICLPNLCTKKVITPSLPNIDLKFFSRFFSLLSW